MDDETSRALNAINRAFYRERADAFDRTRRRPWPGWGRVVAQLEGRPGPEGWCVLDVGCGNGRFAAFLDATLGRRGQRFRYVGVDASEPLLQRARARELRSGRAELIRADWVETPPERALPPGRFSLVVLFGVLNHVPGAGRRRALLEAASRRLAPGGLLAFTTWRPDEGQRLRSRVLPWAEHNRTAAPGVDPGQLEPGDHLLRWGAPGEGAARYFHPLGDAEADRLAAGLGLAGVASFRGDGRGGDHNRYRLLRAGG